MVCNPRAARSGRSAPGHAFAQPATCEMRAAVRRLQPSRLANDRDLGLYATLGSVRKAGNRRGSRKPSKTAAERDTHPTLAVGSMRPVVHCALRYYRGRVAARWPYDARRARRARRARWRTSAVRPAQNRPARLCRRFGLSSERDAKKPLRSRARGSVQATGQYPAAAPSQCVPRRRRSCWIAAICAAAYASSACAAAYSMFELVFDSASSAARRACSAFASSRS
ncbi:hypothetical protein SAMN05216551_105167 [Chitinasiproducens palmae]|uniref:Uncharacterized protein n=1 Tax=Chitinasiproducens palmae TaxID=1770053 RepID=A0A1H2PP64_9BURK|nr:hypothetical protein SAMN05216551_105167 [Chitinasiproducens palmae]